MKAMMENLRRARPLRNLKLKNQMMIVTQVGAIIVRLKDLKVK